MAIKDRIPWLFLLGCLAAGTALPAFGQTGAAHFSVHFTPFSPILALIAGILILVFPRILNYIVAIYLIIIGIAGIFLH